MVLDAVLAVQVRKHRRLVVQHRDVCDGVAERTVPSIWGRCCHMREVCCHMRKVLASGRQVLGFWSGDAPPARSGAIETPSSSSPGGGGAPLSSSRVGRRSSAEASASLTRGAMTPA